MFVEMKRKPENGAEIQNAACGGSVIMMWLRIVKYASNEQSRKIMNKIFLMVKNF